MDLEARKISFIQEFLRLNNETIISKFEEVIQAKKKRLYEKEMTPMSVAEFNDMIDKAEEDAANGRTKSADELNRDIDSWK
jgi:hypothetical protein